MRAVIAATAVTTVLLLAPTPSMACNDRGNCENAPGQINHSNRGAPAPIVGAGLPLLAAGFGVYWLMKRRRKADD
jgi:hypothetical protein